MLGSLSHSRAGTTHARTMHAGTTQLSETMKEEEEGACFLPSAWSLPCRLQVQMQFEKEWRWIIYHSKPHSLGVRSKRKRKERQGPLTTKLNFLITLTRPSITWTWLLATCKIKIKIATEWLAKNMIVKILMHRETGFSTSWSCPSVF